MLRISYHPDTGHAIRASIEATAVLNASHFASASGFVLRATPIMTENVFSQLHVVHHVVTCSHVVLVI